MTEFAFDGLESRNSFLLSDLEVGLELLNCAPKIVVVGAALPAPGFAIGNVERERVLILEFETYANDMLNSTYFRD